MSGSILTGSWLYLIESLKSFYDNGNSLVNLKLSAKT